MDSDTEKKNEDYSYGEIAKHLGWFCWKWLKSLLSFHWFKVFFSEPKQKPKTDVKDFFFSFDTESVQHHYLTHIFWHIWNFFRNLFRNPYQKKKKELDLLDRVQLLSDGDLTQDNNTVKLISKLIRLHRIVENTRARRRLERWSLRVIGAYLLIVMVIVITNYINIDIKGIDLKFYLNIPPEIMITILSTTTINIIGLGLIVLRGHFLSKNDIKDDDDEEKV